MYILIARLEAKWKNITNHLASPDPVSPMIDLSTRLFGINPTISVVIPQSLVLRSIVLGWKLVYWTGASGRSSFCFLRNFTEARGTEGNKTQYFVSGRGGGWSEKLYRGKRSVRAIRHGNLFQIEGGVNTFCLQHHINMYSNRTLPVKKRKH